MKPGPPQTIKIKQGSFLLLSEPNKSTHIYLSKLLNKELIWQFEEYIGQKQALISPDGKTVVLIGNEHFGITLRNDEHEIVLEIKSHETKSIKYNYEQLTGHNLAFDINKYDLSEKGGGWIRVGNILDIESIDWEKKVIKFKNFTAKW